MITFNRIIFILILSLFLFSCKKEKVEPKLTPQQQKELKQLIKLNPGVPINILLDIMGITDTANTTGLTNPSDH